ncbi:MAG: SGNH/GDSL hydrolase family protein [Alphaproteobacteria bacterium]
MTRPRDAGSAGPPVRRRRGEALAAPLLALVSLLVALAAGEAAVRMVLGRDGLARLPHACVGASAERRAAWRARRDADGGDPYGFDQPDPRLGWRLAPGVDVRSAKPGSYDVRVRSNPQGLRGARPAATEPTAGVLRVAIFGDSQTFGEGVGDDETYAALLGRAHPAVEVLNFGVHGFGTDQMLLRWEEEGRRFRPDVVVLAIAWFHADRNASDFTFYAKPRFVLGEDGTPTPSGGEVAEPAVLAAAPPPADEAPCPAADRSALARWLWQRVRNLREREALRPAGAPWRLTRALVARFVEEVRRTGARFVLLDIDDEQPALSDDLRRLAAEIGADYVAAGPAVSAAEKGGASVRLAGDRHWNARGHAIVAAELDRWLCGAHPLVCGLNPAEPHAMLAR